MRGVMHALSVSNADKIFDVAAGTKGSYMGRRRIGLEMILPLGSFDCLCENGATC